MNGPASGEQRLMISYSYAPVLNPRAFRWTAIAEEWARQGHRVDVICAWKPGLPWTEVRNGVYIHRTAVTAVEEWRVRLGKPDLHLPSPAGAEATWQAGSQTSGRPGGPSTGRTVVRQALRPIAKWVHDRVWQRLHWPDATCLWYFPALRKAQELIRAVGHRVVISVSPSFTAHVVGYVCKKEHPAILWVMDIGDPFSFLEEEPVNNRHLYNRLNYWFERLTFCRADGVAVTTAATRARYAALFPESAAKMHVIPALIPPAAAETAMRAAATGAAEATAGTEVTTVAGTTSTDGSLFPNDGQIRLAFVGRLYRHIRTPDFLLRLLGQLLETDLADRLELHFFGDISECRDRFAALGGVLGRRVFLHGLVSRATASQAMQAADVLVNIGNTTAYQLPSKVVEYAGTGKPILHLALTGGDSAAAFLCTYPAALCVTQNAESPDPGQVEAVLRFIEHLPPPVEPRALQDCLAPFQFDAIAAAYARLLSPSHHA